MISLPSGVFKPYAGVATAALIFQKGKPTESVWFYDITADGFSLDDKRTPIWTRTTFPTCLPNGPTARKARTATACKLRRFARTNGVLAARRYKPVTIVAVNHDAPADTWRM